MFGLMVKLRNDKRFKIAFATLAVMFVFMTMAVPALAGTKEKPTPIYDATTGELKGYDTNGNDSSIELTVDEFNDQYGGVQLLNNVIGWVANWAGKIGLVIAFFGGLQTAMGFMNDDADAKVRGLKTMASGFMVWGICEVYDTLFISSGNVTHI